MEKSDVVISNFDSFDDAPSAKSQHDVFVVKATECGRPGHFMHISPATLLNQEATNLEGPLDKVNVVYCEAVKEGE